MKLHLDLKPESPPYSIKHSDSLFLTGSCFTSHIGQRLWDAGFNVHKSPAGTVFNPLSLAEELLDLIKNEPPNQDYFLKRDKKILSFEAHSDVWANTNEDLLEKIIQLRKQARQKLQTANYLFITVGTAYYYQHRVLKKVVANCHKQAGSDFEKKLASPEEILSQFEILCEQLRIFNPSLKIILTVSPVRHLRDGIVENNLSKSILRYALHLLCIKQADCIYFPAYELVNDDLKDYRFYTEDLAHPTSQAIDYVWNKFSATYFNPHTNELAGLYEEKTKALAHKQKPGEAPDRDYLNYLKKIDEKIEVLKLRQ